MTEIVASVELEEAPFAHLAKAVVEGVARPAPVEAAEAPVEAKAEDDEEAKKSKKSKKAKADDDCDDDDKKDKDEKKSKKADKNSDGRETEKCVHPTLAYPEAGSDATDRSDERDEVMAAARGRERARIAAIVLSEVGQANQKLAYNLALKTSMSRNEALAVLDGMPVLASEPAPRKIDALRDRMAEVPEPNVGGVDASQEAPTLAQQIILAGKKRRGEI